MGSLGRRLRKLLREQEGAVERYLMPDGQVWRFSDKDMDLARFAIAVSNTIGQEIDPLTCTKQERALLEGTRITAAGKPYNEQERS